VRNYECKRAVRSGVVRGSQGVTVGTGAVSIPKKLVAQAGCLAETTRMAVTGTIWGVDSGYVGERWRGGGRFLVHRG